ncbi:PPK2 family polyphosphate kinase [Owenweeksia hongkongensis]|uniref:Polyphosphate:nucleotide phosphotransferase, PPK2 family n=1 Tax=Owenweeksia hongkongensis (strain DSM 17368 / CIP 108786 / JCM 12287 / NRRL B-23963 / UST20020801) TaxID=926562 RepID=G8R7P9_OWEHD|nr:polyphosphate--nucleotide phosphotransferase [Owenweeksia hongkongensis]AEV33430.1 polyphosphate:nucleotide phosphotransferase, PPK2 family [Owenweeksia hongkongensis DSM 17368]
MHITDFPTTAPTDLSEKKITKKFKKLQDRLFDLQHLLYANQKNSVLIILQGLDAAGKDSTIRHVFSCLNPTGCNVTSFKKPTEEELMYGFLWRIYKHLPAKGMIQIFNRSHYEDILVPTVHETADASRIEHRYDYINDFEQHLQMQGTLILKFFLNLSEEAQQAKLKARLKDPKKQWKYDEADTKEQKNRQAYLETYERIFERCSPQIPWQIIPAEDKWYRNYLIAKAVVEKLETLNMTYPKPS